MHYWLKRKKKKKERAKAVSTLVVLAVEKSDSIISSSCNLCKDFLINMTGVFRLN